MFVLLQTFWGFAGPQVAVWESVDYYICIIVAIFVALAVVPITQIQTLSYYLRICGIILHLDIVFKLILRALKLIDHVNK